ncbi:hypothetical protein Syun_001436 [Stephania yunnanensis]|uniref:Protein kinase domain-containing protein n=1 Tax=Stephania yunnanensis TaxID=152371 RepID=A0AAP0LDX7_9MAGN
MAMAFLFKFLFVVVVVLYCVGVVGSHQQDQDDRSAMFALKRELLLSSWASAANDSDYCSWAGVLCTPNTSLVESLDLSHHQLGGNVTSSISLLKGLKVLDLSYNNLQGPIPPSFGNLTQLRLLDLSFNKFESSIPPALAALTKLTSLNLSTNSLGDRIPDELHSLKDLEYLQLSGNNLIGSIPSWVAKLTNLKVFTAYENGLGGRIPENLGSFSPLEVLNLHSNHLEGPIPDSIFHFGKLEILVLTLNKLNGNLPAAVGNCKGLSSLRLGNNRLFGNIPSSIGNISSLTYFEADYNHLSGEIVRDFARCTNLTLLNLAFNGFTGVIPAELGELMNLQELILCGNSLYGDIPTSFLKSKNLSKLDLSNNRLNGTIPKDLCGAPRLQFLIVGQNSLRGEIPNEIGNCVKLLELQMGSNYLTGTIPSEISQIKNLQVALNLSFNHLRGPLPAELGKLDKLVSLDVSNNQLSGNIPSALKGMMSLIEVNFSHNFFTGQVPIFSPFQNSPTSSFVGNKELCGEPLRVACANSLASTRGAYHHKVSYRIILAVIGSGLTVFIMVTVVVLLFMVRERQEKAAEGKDVMEEDKNAQPPVITASNVFVENLRQEIDFEVAVKATMKDANKLTTGTFSTIYKAVMPSGLILSVKQLKSMDRTVIHQQSKMIREVERLGRLSHDCLLSPIGFVIYEDIALLLHQYFPNGTLAQLIHDSVSKAEYELDWPTRYSIAVGVAEGLAFLHHLAIVHLDISTVNIFLDAAFKPLIGEIEISKLLDPSKGTASISAVAGSFGYIPPEYAYTMQVTAPGNVYSYGVVLLEILTSRLPVDEAFGEGMDLVKWVHSAPMRGETPEQILDARLSTVSFAWRKQMLGVLKMALLCTDTIPAKRPKMKKVIEMLGELS